MDTIGNRIKQRRLELGLSADELAIKLGKNRATIYRYESNEIENFPTTVLEPLAKVLETTPAYLIGWDKNINDGAKDPDENDVLKEVVKPRTLAAHFDGDEFTDEELDEIRQFAEFVKNKRKK